MAAGRGGGCSDREGLCPVLDGRSQDRRFTRALSSNTGTCVSPPGGCAHRQTGAGQTEPLWGEPCFLAVDGPVWCSWVRSGAAAGVGLACLRARHGTQLCGPAASTDKPHSKHRQAPQLLTVPRPTNPSQRQLIPMSRVQRAGLGPQPRGLQQANPRGAELQVGGTRERGSDPHCRSHAGAETTLVASGPRSPRGGQAKVCGGSPALLPKG